MIKILFVCTGNHVRSPLALAAFKQLVEQAGLAHQFELSSAGTTDYYRGRPADNRVLQLAARQGLDLDDFRGRCIEADELDYYDLILVMDELNMQALASLNRDMSRVNYLSDYNQSQTILNPDLPGQTSLDASFNHIQAATRGLLANLQALNLKDQPMNPKKPLTALQEYVCLKRGTEPPGSGEYIHHKQKGVYHCVVCDHALFRSTTKFDSASGWPSFFDALNEHAITRTRDTSHGMDRVEVSCQHCQAHLGHVFEDGPQPSGLRYCINSVALMFKAEPEEAASV